MKDVKNNELLNPASIREIAMSFQQSRVLLTACELDLFTVLDGHMTSSEEAAAKMIVDARALDRLLNALVSMGFVHKTHGKYYNTEESSKYLVKGKPGYMSGLMHSNNLWNSWSTLTEAVRKGTSVPHDEPGENDSLESFISAMDYRAVPQSKIISFLIDFSNVKKILDLGGGSGAFAITFAKNNPSINAIVFDIPEVIGLTQKYVSDENLLDRVGFIKGNYLVDDLGSGYDLIFASAIVHINSFNENMALIQKCFNALNPGGKLVIVDFVMNEARTEPPAGTIFALNMLVNTAAGDTYTEKEIVSWYTSAGFENIEKKETSFGTALMIGKKREY